MKKIVFLTLTLLLLAALCVGIGFSAMAADTDHVNALEQTIMAGYALPEIPEDAEPIGSPIELIGMLSDGTYYLTADISLPTSYGSAFSGTLYGNGHTITVSGKPVFVTLNGATVRDLTVAGTVTNDANTYQNVGGLVREAFNANIIGVTNKASIHQAWKGNYAGGVAGYAENTTFQYCVNYGDITGHADEFRPGGIMGQCNNAEAWIVLENCINHGTVNGVNQTGGLISRIENGSSLRMTDCANFGTVNVKSSDGGGLIGKVTKNYTELTLERCYNSGRLNGGTNSGGITGYTAASKLTMTDCYNGCFVDDCDCNGTEHGYITQKGTGDIGGLIASFNQSGHAEIALVNCTNYGDVYTTFGSRIGGIAGCLEGKTLSASNCHNYGDLTSANYGGGLFSRAGCTEGTLLVENCSNNGSVTITKSYGGGLIGYEQYSPAIKMVNCVNNGTVTTTWNAGGILCRIDGNLSPKPNGIEFINCVNNGDVFGNGGTAGGILGIMETRSDAEKEADKGLFTEAVTSKVAYLIFTDCSNTGNILSPNYSGGMTGIAWAANTTMTRCTNSGDMMLKPNSTDYAEVGGLAGRIWGALTATDCVNTGDICPTAKDATYKSNIVMGGIVGRVGVDREQKDTDGKKHYLDYTKNHFATFNNCINTGTLGGSKAIADAATTYGISAGGIIGNSKAKCTAKNCVNTGDIFCNQQVGGISALAGQNNVGGSTYEGCVVTGNIYNSGHKTTYNSAGAAGISCYVWGHAIVKRCTITSDIYVGTSGSSKAMADRWACAVLVGYTNNEGGVFQYNYFTGALTSGGGTDCYLVFVANTKNGNVTSDEGGDINYNYSVNEYNLHANQNIGYSVSKTTSKTTAEMVALSSDFLAVRYCDGAEIPIDKSTRLTYATALSYAGHQVDMADVDSAQHGAICACGAVVYENHAYDHACDTDCNVCGHVRTVAEHVGLYDCSTTCKHCGETITAKSEHTGEKACSATCQWCDAAIENPADHTNVLPCDTACSLCGASITGEAHTGVLACSEACQWCDTTITGAKHQGKYACSFTCEACGTDLSNSLPHVGEYVCSDTCKYCGGDIIPQSDHTKEYECSTVCEVCNVTMDGAHVGITDCATKCRYCEITIIPSVSHTTDPEKPCSTRCILCGETTVATQLHTYEKACSPTCSVCGYTNSSAADHDYSAACDATCNQCGFERSASHDPGVQRCADTCMFCGEGLEELGVALIPCAGEYVCSEICQWCGGDVADPAEHTTAYDCDIVCSVCNGAVDSEGHTGLYPCSDTCRYCEIAIEAAGDHKYTDGCDDTCNNCQKKTRNADHRYNNNCDVDCNRCGAIRVPSDHVYQNACDADCNSCGETRVPAEHVYDNPCKDMDCNECGELRTPGDHTYDGCADTDCNGCGTTRTATAHNYEGVEWVVVTPATTEADGLQERACAACGAKETQAIAKLTSGNEGGSMILGLERNTFIIVAGAAAAVILVIVIVVGVAVSKKKKAKKKAEKAAEAAKAEEETAPVEEQEAEEQEASETEVNQGEQE